MKAIPHVPAFIETEPLLPLEVASLSELTGLPFVTQFWSAPGFCQFSKSAVSDGYLLMAEFEGGKRFYVVATLQGPGLDRLLGALPFWIEPV